MKVDLILNTASLDPATRFGRNPYRSAQYQERADILAETLLTVEGFSTIYVCGVYQPGEGYIYLPMAPKFRDRRDALWQRDLAARHSTADILVFCHDDHRPAIGFATRLRKHYGRRKWNILVPKRVHGLTGDLLNNGQSDNYMGAHCFVMRRAAWAEVPFTILDTEFWDVPMTRIWRERGFDITFVEDLVHYDIEATKEEL